VDLNLTRRQLFTMFGSIYFVQGVIQAYQLNFFKPHMDSVGIDADQLAVVSALGLLPFVIKWIFGLVSDRYPLFGRGHRVPYMLIGLASTGVAFFVAFFIDPAQSFAVLAALVLSATFAMALFDTTADALSVDVVHRDDHATVQAWMNGGRAVGIVLLSGLLGLVAGAFGYQWTFLVIAAVTVVPLWFVLRVEEPRERTPAHTFDRRAFKVFAHPQYLLFSVVLIAAWFFFEGIEGLVTFYMSNELGASPTTIGIYGSLKGLGILAGGVSLATLVHRGGRRLGAVLTLSLVTAGGLMFSVLDSTTSILLVAPLWGVAVGFHWTNYVTITMGITDLRIAGSMFAILQTMSNIGLGAGEGVSTALTDNVGFGTLFRSFALLNLLVIPLILGSLVWFDRSRAEDLDAVLAT
jgi:PAT family beta-lactamase induction signal transducer AmpG